MLVISDAKVFLESARHTGNTHFVNALVLAIKRGVTQVILEGRDDDLELIFSCHPHIQEAFTMMELAEPDAKSLQAMVRFGAERLTGDHGIRIDTDAAAAAIELTNNYRADGHGMDRAQPERSVSLLDRALASYRLEAHEKPPHLAQLQARTAAAKGDEANVLTAEIARATQEWEQAQSELRAANRRQREGEEELAKIEWEITDLGKREVDQRTALPEHSFNLMANNGWLQARRKYSSSRPSATPSPRSSKRRRRLSQATPRQSTIGCCLTAIWCWPSSAGSPAFRRAS